MLACWLVGSGLAIWAAWTMIVPQYRASSLIRVEPSRADLFEAKPPANLDMILLTQVQLLTGPNVLAAAATNPLVARLPRMRQAADVLSELRKCVQASIRPGTYLIEVAMDSNNPTEAAVVVNAVVEAFLMMNGEWSDGMHRTQIRTLENYLAELRTKAEEYERRWKELAKQLDRRDAAVGPDRMVEEHKRRIEAKLIEEDIRRIEIQGRLEALGRRNEPKDRDEVASCGSELEVIAAVEAKLRERLAALSARKNDDAANEIDITLIKQELDSLRGMMAVITRRLDQLRFDAKGDAAIKQLAPAIPLGRPFSDLRPMVLGLIPVAVAAVLGLSLLIGGGANKPPGA